MESFHMSRFHMLADRLTIEGGVNLLPFYHVEDGERLYRGHHRDAWLSADAVMLDEGGYMFEVMAFGERREGRGTGPIVAALADIFAALDEIVEARYADELSFYREMELVGNRVYASAKGERI